MVPFIFINGELPWICFASGARKPSRPTNLSKGWLLSHLVSAMLGAAENAKRIMRRGAMGSQSFEPSNFERTLIGVKQILTSKGHMRSVSMMPILRSSGLVTKWLVLSGLVIGKSSRVLSAAGTITSKPIMTHMRSRIGKW